ncbi:unnamed protein product [Prorocentrum cordatum]|uniref:ShKT domain-containing protein n=1 Tax=Prorocentrum cordatum TaxID=2364126 RepID=A0ABN9U5W9_9DINO|nr:unnamed protein product [Polarella glacialis]
MHGGRAAACLLLLLAVGAAGDETCGAGECGADEAALLARKADVHKHGQGANATGTICGDATDVPGPMAKGCSWMKTPPGDDCAQATKGACMCRDYNLYRNGCPICEANPCTKRYCFDIVDLPGNSCQWMYNSGDDCQQQTQSAIDCRNANQAHCPRPCR